MADPGHRAGALPRSGGRGVDRASEYAASVGTPAGASEILASLERSIECPVWVLAPAAVVAGSALSEPAAAAVAAAERLVAGANEPPSPDEPPLTVVPLAGAGPGAPPAHLVCECDLDLLGADEQGLIEQAAMFMERHRALVAQMRVSRRAAGREFLERSASGDVSESELAAWARALGIGLSGHVVAVVAQVSGATAADLEEVASGLEDLADADRVMHLVIVRDGELCGLLLADGGATSDASPTLQRFERLAAPRLERLGGAIGTASMIAGGISDAVRVLHDARRVSQLNHLTAPARPAPAQVVAERPLVMQLLSERRAEMETLRSVMLDPLEAYDARHGTELVRTLDVFLSTGGQWSVSANLLGVHVNTLRYRLSRVEKCSGRDPASMASRVDFYLALRSREELAADEPEPETATPAVAPPRHLRPGGQALRRA